MKSTHFHSPASVLLLFSLLAAVVHAAPVPDAINDKSGLLSQIRIWQDSVSVGIGTSDVSGVQWDPRPSEASEVVDVEGDKSVGTAPSERSRSRGHVHSDNTFDGSPELDRSSNDDPKTLIPARTTYGPKNMIYSLDIESLIIWISVRPVWAWSVVITLLVLLFLVSVAAVEVTSVIYRALKPIDTEPSREDQKEGIDWEKGPLVIALGDKTEWPGDEYGVWEMQNERNKHSVLE